MIIKNKTTKIQAFTLVELAIVIVIIGLLVGGVLAGQELIKQAKIRKDVKRITEVSAAIHTFYSKYNFIPGDYPASVSMRTLGVTGGDGDGRIVWGNPEEEEYYFWQHLVYAKMLNIVQYNGNPYIKGNGRQGRYVRFDDSRGSLSAMLYSSTGDAYATAVFGVPRLGNTISISNHDGIAGYASYPADVTWSIDEKIDDGQPTTGKFLGANSRNKDDPATVVVCNNAGRYVNEEAKNVCRILYSYGL